MNKLFALLSLIVLGLGVVGCNNEAEPEVEPGTVQTAPGGQGAKPGGGKMTPTEGINN